MTITRKKKLIKRFIWILVILLILINLVAIFHSYKFTHFADNNIEKTKNPSELNSFGKIKTLIFGIDNPRPVNKAKPKVKYETIILQSNREIACWHLKNHQPQTKGTIILCHGYSGEKSSMLDKAEIFDSLGYNTFLIDFMGSGGSEGNTTTLGFKEAEQVKTAYEYLQNNGVENIYLFGTSMGAVAIMKAMNDYELNPHGIILECPFGSMYQTVCARFRSMNAPTFPMAGLLVFWGGIQNGFWAFGHKPMQYAKNISCPTLLLYGEQDKNVSLQEIDNIYNNLTAEKQLRSYPLAGHENYLTQYKSEWTEDVREFLFKTGKMN